MAAELSTELCNLCFAAYVLLCQLHCLLLCGPCRRVREPATGPLFAESTVHVLGTEIECRPEQNLPLDGECSKAVFKLN